MTMAHHRVHGVDTRIIRIFNTYGPRMRQEDGRAIPNFITQALRGGDISVFGDGSQTRSFCFISDLAEGIYRVLMSGETRPVNLGNPQELTILELANEIVRLTGSSSKIVYTPLPQDDPKRRQPDISRASQLCGWEPKVEFPAGLRETIAYFRGKLA
jgi:dTDP-glucose 4,6-dehydratase